MAKVEVDISQGSFRIYEHGGRMMLCFRDGSVEAIVRLAPASALVLAGALIENVPHVGKSKPDAAELCVATMAGPFGEEVRRSVEASARAGIRREE